MRPEREPLAADVQVDEALVKAGVNELVLVASESGGRVRLAHVVTDGHAGYNATSPEKRTHEPKVQTKSERAVGDAVQSCHWTISLLKRWLLGTHAVSIGTQD